MKKIISLALIGATTSLFAMYAEHASLYKDPRIMGMGGTNVAVGGYSTSVFSNPAGLTNIKKDHGFVVDLLGLGVSATPEVIDFLNDFDDANGDSVLIGDVLKKYAGDHFHLGISNYSSISKNSDLFAWSVGILAASDFNFMTHSDLSLTSTSRIYGGLVLGAAKPYDTKFGRIDVGVSAKIIQQESYEGTLTVIDLIGTVALVDDIENKLKSDTGIGIDVGVIYYPSYLSSEYDFLNLAIGASVMNIGSINMNDNFGGQPTTVNLGLSITPDIPALNKLVVAIDYVDLFNANELRLYNSDGSYNDYEESDIMKRVRLGVGIGLIDSTFFSTTLNLGMYQANYTAGINMEILTIKLNLATYAEEISTAGIGEDTSDRRYMAQIGFGW